MAESLEPWRVHPGQARTPRPATDCARQSQPLGFVFIGDQGTMTPARTVR